MTNTPEWNDWDTNPPQSGQKIVIVCDDGCSSSLALITDDGPIDGEDGLKISDFFFREAIWIPLPDNYPLRFMEDYDDQ